MINLLFGPLLIVALLVRALFFEPFYIPSGAMVPTLLAGDYLFVSKFSYGYSRFSLPFGLPLFSGRIFGFGKPRRGDVAVFKLPTDTSANYIQRIAGLPGDRVQMIHGQLYINGEQVPRRQIDDYQYQKGGTSLLMHEYVEALPRGPGEKPYEHPIIKIGDDGPLDNTPVYAVPRGHYFVLGDNRDNSQDSRVMSAVGFVPADNLVGRAGIIFYSANGSETRSDRMFAGVH